MNETVVSNAVIVVIILDVMIVVVLIAVIITAVIIVILVISIICIIVTSHGAKTKKHSPPGRGSTSATPHSDGKKQKAAGEQRELHSNATKPSKRSSSSKASLSKASSRADLIASKSQKTYDAQKGSSASTPNRAAAFFKAMDPSPQGYSNLHTPEKAKDPLRRKSRAQSRESPKDATPGNISVKPTWKGAETAARETDHGAGKRRGPSSVERSGVSRASSKRASPAKEEDKGSPATADKRSLRSKASRTSRHSPSSSSKRSMHSLRKHGGRCGDLPGERDFSVASVIPLVGGSRKSAGSSKRSLRPLEEGSVEEKEERKKHGEEKLLVMPDGTRVSVAEKNLWISERFVNCTRQSSEAGK
ncbi:uncharacterized protein LOC144160147 [Haemaphysalis longicornis]